MHHFFALLLVFGTAFGAALAFAVADGALAAAFASGIFAFSKNFLSFLVAGLGSRA